MSRPGPTHMPGAPNPLAMPVLPRGYTDQTLDDGPAMPVNPAVPVSSPALRAQVRNSVAAQKFVRKAPALNSRLVFSTDAITPNGTLNPIGTGPAMFPPFREFVYD